MKKTTRRSRPRRWGAWSPGLHCHVNLIPLNPTTQYGGRPSSRRRVAAFQEILNRHGVTSTVRVRRGIDIQAGCGQLRDRVLEEMNRVDLSLLQEEE